MASSSSVQTSHYEGRHVSAKKSLASWTVIAASSPFSVFRNAARYVHDPSNNYEQGAVNPSRKAWSADARKKANDQSLFYLQEVADHAIPTGLLYETLLDDITARRKPATYHRRNTITQFHHGNTQLMVHAGGRNLDELVVRNVSFLQPQYRWQAQPSFSINLGQGSPLLQVASVGKSAYGVSTNLLVRTAGEIFHVQTRDLSQLNQEHSKTFGQLLEPKAKYQPPETFCDMTTSSESSWNYAYFISQRGTLYSWNPQRGVYKQSTAAILPHVSVDPMHFAEYSPKFMIEASLHPKILYAAHGNGVYHYDVRTAKATSLFTNRFQEDHIDYNHQDFRSKVPRNEKTSSVAIHSIKTHSNAEHLFVVSTPTSLLLMDARYSKTHLFKKATFYPHDHLQHCRLNMWDQSVGSHDAVDLFLGMSRSSGQVNIHAMTQPYQGQHSPLACSHLYQSDQHQGTKELQNIYSPLDVLNSTSSFNKSDCVRWETEAFPVVDSFEPCIGASIIPTSRLHQANEDASDMEVDYCGLLVQQSSIGDVFAQRLSTRRPQSIRTTTSTNLSNKTSNTSSKVSSKYVDPHADYFSSDGEEDRTGSKLVSSRIDHGCRVVVPVVYPPVQFNLPIGNRCFSQEPAEKTYNAIISLFETAGPSNRKWLHLEASSAAGSLLKSYIDIRNFFYHHAEQEHSLYPGLITQQRPISIFDIQRGQYPLNHQSFRKFIPEDSLQGMDALELFPQDLRRDLPTLPNEPEFTAIPAAITTVFYLTEIEEFVKQHLEELHNFVGKYSATLWEIWRFLFEKTNRKLSYPVLRQCLLKLNFYELWIPSRKDQSVDVMVSHFSTDGLVVKKMSLRSDASSKSKTKRSLADDDSIVSVINERKNSKRKSSKSGAGGMLSDDDNDGDSDGSKSSRGSRGSSRGGNRDTSNPYSCRCFEDIAELQKWGQGNRGGCLNNANYLLPCSKRNCLIPHRLVYSFTTTQSVPLASSQLHTPHHSSSSQFSFENTTQLDQKSDITDDICAALEDLWDETALTAYPEWPNITDVELHKKKNETL